MMTGEQNIEYLRQQIVQAREGLLTFISCPYCGHENTPVDEYVCCALFGDGCVAVLDRIEKQEAVDFLSTIQDRVN